jgi:hypothetical protein
MTYVQFLEAGITSSLFSPKSTSGLNRQNRKRKRTPGYGGACVCEPSAQQAVDAHRSARPSQGEAAVPFALAGARQREVDPQWLA